MSEIAALHPTAAAGFAHAGADYERGRPGYPAAAVAKLAAALRLAPGRVALDLAAGTGKLTRALNRFGTTLIAVEPVEGMRAQLTSSLPEVRALAGTAEQIPLPDASVDAVLVGQAFHWFDAPAAAKEIHRVLRPGGGLGVIWNAWDESVPWVARIQEIVHEHVASAPQHSSSQWRRELACAGGFSALQPATFPNIVRGGIEVLRARVASVSYISALAADQRERVLDAVAEVVASDPATSDQAVFEMPYTTTTVWARWLPLG